MAKRYLVTSLITLFAILIMFSVSCVDSGQNSITQATADFWFEAKPIVERQIDEFGRPLAELMLEIGADLRAGDSYSFNRYCVMVRDRKPYLSRAFLGLSQLRPPPGLAAEWQTAQLKAWGSRLESIDIIIGNWDFNRRLFIGSDEDAQLWSVMWQQSSLEGREADRLQIRLLQSLQD